MVHYQLVAWGGKREKQRKTQRILSFYLDNVKDVAKTVMVILLIHPPYSHPRKSHPWGVGFSKLC